MTDVYAHTTVQHLRSLRRAVCLATSCYCLSAFARSVLTLRLSLYLAPTLTCDGQTRGLTSHVATHTGYLCALRLVMCRAVQVLRFRCTNSYIEERCFGGLGDRFKGLSVAFWLVLSKARVGGLLRIRIVASCHTLRLWTSLTELILEKV